MTPLRTQVIAALLIAIQVIGGVWALGAEVCLADEVGCNAAATTPLPETACCCRHEEEPTPAEEPCGDECGCCITIPPTGDRSAELLSREGGEAPVLSILATCVAGAEPPARLHEVRPPPQWPPPGLLGVLSTVRLQV